ncbi:MAG: DUF1269 domain-containing protein [Thermomicrobiales bacterium]|nr:DUF1269 domain-containing protein [Thermomicrobiales bacterium]
MSSQNITLLAAKYPNEEHAKTILDMLESMHRALTIDLKDAVMITREADGKIKTHETTDVTTKKGALRGVIAGGILGLIFPPSLLVSALAGGGIGAIWGRIKDSGVKHDDIKELADSLTGDQAAIIVLVSTETAEATQQALGSYDGDLVTKVYSEEDMVRTYENASEG